ncbi:MAG: class II fumarate hydratase [Deltaproteobacteria bacterium]|nr:class II fumarate hydratase [Deltaproteobacteria bacterium]
MSDAEQYRMEKDGMGEVRVPAEAYYGAQTRRAVENFPISGLRFPQGVVKALGLVKKHAARINHALGLLEADVAEAIARAAREVENGHLDEQFVVDIFQTGSGTSTNMNANEVIATRANELLTGRKHTKYPVHPNDHVNKGQSSNDVIPTAIHIAALTAVTQRLLPALGGLRDMLQEKSTQFHPIVKIGRTHLQDAVPVRLGQEFSGFARQIEQGMGRIESTTAGLAELALGGTAVGTGLNAHPEFAAGVIEAIAHDTGLGFVEAANHFEAQAAQDAAVQTSGALKTVAVSLTKIANDIRWMASGPRCGLGEINLPSLQPGSSIMPGKVNPVIPEAVVQVAAQVIGNDCTITLGGQWGAFELNTMLPVIAYNLLESIDLLASAAEVFARKCIRHITANENTCRAMVEKSIAMSTPLALHVGYDRAAAIAESAYESGKTVREVAEEKEILSETELDRLLDPLKMV